MPDRFEKEALRHTAKPFSLFNGLDQIFPGPNSGGDLSKLIRRERPVSLGDFGQKDAHPFQGRRPVPCSNRDLRVGAIHAADTGFGHVYRSFPECLIPINFGEIRRVCAGSRTRKAVVAAYSKITIWQDCKIELGAIASLVILTTPLDGLVPDKALDVVQIFVRVIDQEALTFHLFQPFNQSVDSRDVFWSECKPLIIRSEIHRGPLVNDVDWDQRSKASDGCSEP